MQGHDTSATNLIQKAMQGLRDIKQYPKLSKVLFFDKNQPGCIIHLVKDNVACYFI